MANDLAIDGGRPTVQAAMSDSWEDVTDVERSFIDSVLDDIGSAYDQNDLFEAEYRSFVGTKHALVMCNGTATIHAAIWAAGARPGKEVIVPSVTWHATVSPILHCGATPVFCDADPETYCIDPKDVEAKITDRTCAIVATHVYGNPADLDALVGLVEGTDIILIEDASHAHGALWSGKTIGSIGHIGCFSLQKSKPINAIEAGVATTDSDDLYDRMLAVGQYGRCGSLWQTERFKELKAMGLGVKYRANPLGTALARAGLQRLPELNAKRTAWYEKMDAHIDGIDGVTHQRTHEQARRGGMLLYTGRVDPETVGAPAEAIFEALRAEGVRLNSQMLYGVMHLQPLFTDFSFEGLGGPWGDPASDNRAPLEAGSLPVSEAIQDTAYWLSTPVDPDPEWVDQVGEAFAKVASQGDRVAEWYRDR